LKSELPTNLFQCSRSIQRHEVLTMTDVVPEFGGS